jgi:hypothetical protein
MSPRGDVLAVLGRPLTVTLLLVETQAVAAPRWRACSAVSARSPPGVR